ncbi:hypothetical protein BDBG_16605, partial [Blastomyces gilchristii SLH14081]
QQNLLFLNLLSQNLLKTLKILREKMLILLFIRKKRRKCKNRKIFKSSEIEDLFLKSQIQRFLIASIESSFFENSIILTTMSEFKISNVISMLEITKLVSINVKYTQKEIKYVNILWLNTLTVKKSMCL